MDVIERIKEALESNQVLLFMKGTPEFPQCGFSSQASQAVAACGAEFAYVNVLADQEVREKLKEYSDWPTYPQLYINGELVGGCDIIVQSYESGDLKKMIDEATQAE